MKLVQQSKSRRLSFLLFSLCLSGSVHIAAGSDSSTAMGSSIRSVEDAVYLNVQRTDYYIAPSQLKLECDSASGGDVSFWREQNGLTEEITVAGSVSGGRQRERGGGEERVVDKGFMRGKGRKRERGEREREGGEKKE